MNKTKDKFRSFCNRVSNFVEYCIYELILSDDSIQSSPQLKKTCMKCHKTCDRGYFAIDGHALRFCSEKCYKAAYEQYENYQEALGTKECKLPGCNNKCYITNYGLVYDFCGHSHATLYEQQFSQGTYKIKTCKLPGCCKKCFVDNVTKQVYDFCNKSHALQYQSKLCKLPGCHMPCFVERDGRVYDFCNRTHAEEFKHCYNDQRCYSQFASSEGTIYFYNRGEPYYEFTNFAMYSVWIDEKRWPTTEHYFQAQKFVGTPYEQAIRDLTTPREAFDFSRNPEVHRWRRNDWEQVKEDIMKKALLAKFTQHHELNLKLLSTRNRELVEHTSNDRYWGDGGDGNGQNRLGYLLMSVREELRQSKLSTHKLNHSPDDVQIIKVTTKQESSETVQSPATSKNSEKDLIIFSHHQDDDPQSDGIQASTKPTQCDNATRQGLNEEDLKFLDPLITTQSENLSKSSEGLDSLVDLVTNSLSDPNNTCTANDDSKTQNTSNSSNVNPQPMEEENPSSNSLLAHQPNDQDSTATTSDHPCTQNTSNSSNVDPQLMEEENLSSNSLSAHQPNDEDSTATTSDHTCDSDTMDVTE